MSRRKILAALRKKGLSAETCEYERGVVTPHGYCDGWTVVLDGKSEEAIYTAGYEGDYDCEEETATEILTWVDGLPDCRGVEYLKTPNLIGVINE